MRLLLTFTLVLLTIFAVTASTSMVVGHTQSLPDHLAMLHLEECEPPCWIGIEPGTTPTLDEISGRLAKSYPPPVYSVIHTLTTDFLNGYTGYNYTISQSGEYLFNIDFLFGDGRFSTKRDTLAIIDFELLNAAEKYRHYTFGELHRLFGRPASVRMNHIFTFTAPDMSVVYLKSQGVISINSYPGEIYNTFLTRRVASVWFQDNYSYKLPEMQLLDWRGFSSTDRYIDEYIQRYCASNGLC